MANIKVEDSKTYDMLCLYWGKPVDNGRMTLGGWFSNVITGWGWDSTCHIRCDRDPGWFNWWVVDADGKTCLVGGLIYRDNGWESHT